MDDCLFCKIIRGEIPSYKLYEDEDAFAFLDVFPIKKGQALVIPKKHTGSNFSHADTDSLQKTIAVAQNVARNMEEKLGYDRSFILIQGLGVDHFHVKIYPNYPGEGEEFNAYTPDIMEAPEVLKQIAHIITA